MFTKLWIDLDVAKWLSFNEFMSSPVLWSQICFVIQWLMWFGGKSVLLCEWVALHRRAKVSMCKSLSLSQPCVNLCFLRVFIRLLCVCVLLDGLFFQELCKRVIPMMMAHPEFIFPGYKKWNLWTLTPQMIDEMYQTQKSHSFSIRSSVTAGHGYKLQMVRTHSN